MKIALISDIHGNAVALKAVLQDAKTRGATELLVAGDLSGYYYRLDEVLTLLGEWPWEGIQGNHDAWCVECFAGNQVTLSHYRKTYGSAFDVALQTLSDIQKATLAALPVSKILERDGKRILLCHGAPWSQDTYVYPDAPAETFERIGALGHDIVIMGHTHHPMLKKDGECVIVNPGSVGQPRDEGSNASWALLDVPTGEVEFFRVRFDPAPLLAEIEQHDPTLTYLKEVLIRNSSSHV